MQKNQDRVTCPQCSKRFSKMYSRRLLAKAAQNLASLVGMFGARTVIMNGDWPPLTHDKGDLQQNGL